MAVIEVTFDPTIWTWANGAAWSTYADKDGTTAWAFEAFGGGFARFNLSDGSIIVQDSLFGPPDRTGFGTTNWFINWYPLAKPINHPSYWHGSAVPALGHAAWELYTSAWWHSPVGYRT